MPTYDWTSLRSTVLVTRRVGDLSEFDYRASDEWQDYILEHIDRRRGDHLELIIKDDATDYTFTGGRLKNGKIVATVTVPACWFTGTSALENRPIHREVRQRFFSQLAGVCGWPPPPPPPPMRTFPDEWFLPRAYDGVFWSARRPGFRRPEFQAHTWFQADQLWREYLAIVEADTLSLLIGIVDRDKPKRYGRAKPNGEINATVDLPIDWFVENPDPDLTLVEAIRDTYVWGMKKFGWPEPPPLPSRPVPQ